MKERDIRAELKRRVEARGGEIRALSWLGRRHAPDVLVLIPRGAVISGGHFFVETKRPGKRTTAAQAREHERLASFGIGVTVITTIEELDKFLP